MVIIWPDSSNLLNSRFFIENLSKSIAPEILGFPDSCRATCGLGSKWIYISHFFLPSDLNTLLSFGLDFVRLSGGYVVGFCMHSHFCRELPGCFLLMLLRSLPRQVLGRAGGMRWRTGWR